MILCKLKEQTMDIENIISQWLVKNNMQFTQIQLTDLMFDIDRELWSYRKEVEDCVLEEKVYNEGYNDGYKEGYEEGYDEGVKDERYDNERTQNQTS
jgi:flagellar biosynthesis/type III secretory pathway protein FliH